MSDKPTDNKVLSIVKNAKPANATVTDPFADRRIEEFGLTGNVLCKWKSMQDRETGKKSELVIPLFKNGAALIESEVVADDGILEQRFFTIIGKLKNGRTLPLIKVLAPQFLTMNWPVQQWGNSLIMTPGNGNKDSCRAAIQLLSGEVPVKHEYRHTGWRVIDGQYHYLSGSGAIHADGLNDQISVELDKGHMQHYRLPPPPDNPGEIAGLALRLLDIAPQNRAIGVALLAAISRAPLAEAAPIDFSLFLAGRSGSGKSEVAALALAFFGEFNSRRFPANFSDTESDLQHKAHQVASAVFVIDDFVCNGGSVEASRLQGKAESIFRAVGNQSGRGRRNSDMTGKPAYYPRGMVVATGEDVPRGASLLGRLLIVEAKRGDLDWTQVSTLQQYASSGTFTQIMAAYVAWLAPRMAELKTSLPAKQSKARDQAIAAGFAESHPRAGDIYASLLTGCELFINFLVDVEAVGDVRANDVMDSIAETLKAAIMAQAEYQANSDEVALFRSLLQSCLASGLVHVAHHLKLGPPEIRPYTWGWRKKTEDGEPEGKGMLIGYMNEAKNELWLLPEATFEAIKTLTEKQREPFLIQKATLWKRLHERGVLRAGEHNAKTGKTRPDVKRSVGNPAINPRVLVINPDFITDNDIELDK